MRYSAGLVPRLVHHANVLLPGLYAWVSTVAYPATQKGAAGLARVLAFSALVALVAGPLVAVDRPRLGRAIGVLGFVGLSVITWILLGPVIHVQRLDPLRASLGAVGWALFAFGWGELRQLGSVPEDDPNVIPGPSLPARSALPRGAYPVLVLGVIGAVIPLFLAWRELRPRHALFAHAASVVWAVALITSAARLALDRGRLERERSTPARSRLSSATRPLALLTLALALGLLWLAFD